MSRVYLSGPMTGLPEFNYPAFHAAAAQLRAAGYVVENPAENTAPECKSWQGYMRIAVAQLATCDRIAILPGWSYSKGAKLEVAIGYALGMDVVELDRLLALPTVVTRGSDV